MMRAFNYRESRMTFVVISLAGWFGILGLVGQYLPANALVTNRQVVVNLYGNQLTGHWVKKQGRWHFLKISKISKLEGFDVQRTASITPPKSPSGQVLMQESPDMRGPQTTASIDPSRQRKARKKAQRAALADEIGRWSKIGNRWEWQAVGRAAGLDEGKPRQADGQAQTHSPDIREPGARWVQREGSWSFETVDELVIVRNI